MSEERCESCGSTAIADGGRGVLICEACGNVFRRQSRGGERACALDMDVYRRGMSDMYYKKMLARLGMSEEQFLSSQLDARTDEYFVLAQSYAPPEATDKYADILARLDGNRARARAEEKDRADRLAAGARRKRLARIFALVSACVAYYVLLAAAFAAFGHGGEIYLLSAQVFRIAADVAICFFAGKLRPLTYGNLISGLCSSAYAVALLTSGGGALAASAAVASAIALIAEVITLYVFYRRGEGA